MNPDWPRPLPPIYRLDTPTMPKPLSFQLLSQLAASPDHGWSVGSFGAVGEFVRDPEETAHIHQTDDLFEIATERGAMRLTATENLTPIAWESLSSDGETWGQHFDVCVPQPITENRVLRDLGLDHDAIRPQDKCHRLFDLGVSCGAITMAVRTNDAAFIRTLEKHVGGTTLEIHEIYLETLRAQPHRVLLSPAARIEVFQHIPAADGKSPSGPHTHLISHIAPKYRPHNANSPVPDGMQSAISVHMASPWRDLMGQRHLYRLDKDQIFAPYLRDYELSSDKEIAATLRQAIHKGVQPSEFSWPSTRRGRTKARITLRRMAVEGVVDIEAWRRTFDRLVEDEPA